MPLAEIKPLHYLWWSSKIGSLEALCRTRPEPAWDRTKSLRPSPKPSKRRKKKASSIVTSNRVPDGVVKVLEFRLARMPGMAAKYQLNLTPMVALASEKVTEPWSSPGAVKLTGVLKLDTYNPPWPAGNARVT